MFVGLCLGIFSAFMTKTQVAAQTQDNQDLVNQYRTLINETNQMVKEIVDNFDQISAVRTVLASLPDSTDQQVKQQLLDLSQTLVNQTEDLILDLIAQSFFQKFRRN